MTAISVRDATDADYNAHSRRIDMKLEIYFDGRSNAPTTVTIDNYLIDADLLEEASAESSNPLGAISANELSFSLYNKLGMFSPTNQDSPYYGKIKTNVLIVPYFKPADTHDTVFNWCKMGEYYVYDWSAAITGSTVNVSAADKLQQVFLEPSPVIKVETNKTQRSFFQEVFDSLGYSAVISQELSAVLLYTFVDGEPKQFLQEMLQGAIAYCTCDKSGNIVIIPLNGAKPLRAVLADSDQIIDVDATQSIIKTYSGVELTYMLPQLTDVAQLLHIKDANVPAGIFTHNSVAFSKGPVKTVSSVCAITDNKEVSVIDYTSSPWSITLITLNEGTKTISDIIVYGTSVDFVEALMTDNVTNALKVKNRYVQSTAYASKYKRILDAFVDSDMPVITVKVRGNPLLNIGDKIRIVSTKYSIDFTGIIQRIRYTYAGSLSCEITLLNSSILEASR